MTNASGATFPSPAEIMGTVDDDALARLRAVGDDEREKAERAYMQALEERCEDLLRRDPVALEAVAAAVPLALLSLPRDQALLRYYRALGAGLNDRYDEALAGLEALLREPSLDEVVRGRALNSAALFAQSYGDFQRALVYSTASYAIWQQLGNRFRRGLSRHNQGLLHYELQNYTEAEACFHEALAVFRAIGAEHEEALGYLELGLIHRDQGRWGPSLHYSRLASEIFAREGATDFLARATNNIGEVELFCGRYDAATEAFDRAAAGMTTRVYLVDVHINRGLLAQARGDDAAAIGHYQTALDLALAIQRGEVAPLVHYRIGQVEQRMGRLDAAQASYAAAIMAVEARRAPIHDEGLLISLMGRWQLVYEAAIRLCLERGDAVEALTLAERARARAFADLVSRRQLDLIVGTEAPIAAAEAIAALPRGTLLLAYFAGGVRGPESALLDAMPPAASGVRACLNPAPYLARFALWGGTVRAELCPLDPNALHSASSYLADGQRFLRPEILRRCYAALLEPVSDVLGEAERLVVVPHGPLHQLPFAALQDAQGLPLLDLTRCVSYAPSITLSLRARRRSSPPARSCLALGYAGADRRLRHTEAEVETVTAICDGDRLEPEAGVLAHFLTRAGDYQRLHLACHGEFDTAAPLESFLEVGPGARLTAADVLSRVRLRADLVTLSACRSGVSHVLRGDEPMGLVRAFLAAGASDVIVTLWPVEDESACVLMEHLYRTLIAQSDSTDPAAALHAAQIALRAYTRPDGTQPFAATSFWAPYALIHAG
jgi:tetratricopeptide (TPR) repeat protein